MAENENAAATEQAATETNETQKTEEVTEAVETQAPATEKGIEDGDASQETAKTDSTETKTETVAEANTDAAATETAPAEETKIPDDEQEISYHAVEKEGAVTAIWEMQGRKHLRTIDPRSNEGKKILSLFETAV